MFRFSYILLRTTIVNPAKCHVFVIVISKKINSKSFHRRLFSTFTLIKKGHQGHFAVKNQATIGNADLQLKSWPPFGNFMQWRRWKKCRWDMADVSENVLSSAPYHCNPHLYSYSDMSRPLYYASLGNVIINLYDDDITYSAAAFPVLLRFDWLAVRKAWKLIWPLSRYRNHNRRIFQNFSKSTEITGVISALSMYLECLLKL